MVTLLILIGAAFLASLIAVANLWLRVVELEKGKPPAPAQNFIARALGFKAEPEAPKDYAQTSIPRTRGPWRRQMRDLQAKANSKQKERDALIPKENHAKTR